MSSERKISQFPVKSAYHPETAENILRAFPEFQAGQNDPDFMVEWRKDAMDYVLKHGLPTPKLEGWKYTNIIPRVRSYGENQGRTKVSSNKPAGVVTVPLTRSIIENEWVKDLVTEPLIDHEHNVNPILCHLANVYYRDGVSIDVPANTQVQEPLEILMECFDGEFFMVHTAIRVQKNSSLTIIEDHRGQGTFWKNRFSHITLEPGAKLTHIRIQEDPDSAVYTQNTKVRVARDAHYNALALYTGAAISRNQIHVMLNEPGAKCHLNGASLLRGAQHSDTTILVEHKAPHCESNQNMRTILDDQAHGVSQGKVHVHRPAQKTDGYQLSKAILLSEGAEMDSKPELEIYADDVKCSHGSTTGRLEDEPMFYMQSRGIPENEARALLIESFAGEVFDQIDDDDLRESLLSRVRGWLRHE